MHERATTSPLRGQDRPQRPHYTLWHSCRFRGAGGLSFYCRSTVRRQGDAVQPHRRGVASLWTFWRDSQLYDQLVWPALGVTALAAAGLIVTRIRQMLPVGAVVVGTDFLEPSPRRRDVGPGRPLI